jgi:hypothetical protein
MRLATGRRERPIDPIIRLVRAVLLIIDQAGATAVGTTGGDETRMIHKPGCWRKL